MHIMFPYTDPYFGISNTFSFFVRINVLDEYDMCGQNCTMFRDNTFVSYPYYIVFNIII